MSAYNDRLNGLNPLSYLGVNPYTPVALVIQDDAPTPSDSQNVTLGTLWFQQGTQNIWFLTSLVGGAATWTQLLAGASGAETFVTNSGTAHSLAGVINLLGAGSTTTSGAGDTVLINSSGGGGGTPNSFNAVLTSPQTIPFGDTDTIVFDTLTFENGVGYGTATGIYTVPSTGAWRINTGISGLTNPNGGDTLTLVYNGSPYATILVATATDASNYIDIEMPLTVGDTLVVQYTSTSGSTNVTIPGSAAPYPTWFEAVQLIASTSAVADITIEGDTGSPQTTNAFLLTATATSGSTVSFNASNTGLITLNTSDFIFNTIIGSGAGNSSVTGGHNTGIGSQSLESLAGGMENMAVGSGALLSLASGNYNVAIGALSGDSLVSGSSNVLIGTSSGENYTGAESNNILIGGQTFGTSGESGTIRIGSSAQTSCYIAGISGVTVSPQSFVTINPSTGQLGVTSGGTSTIILAGDTGTPQNSSSFTITTGLSTLNSGSSMSFAALSPDIIQLNVTDASSNTIIGSLSGNSSITGTNNTSVGAGALVDLTSGSYNSTLGQGSGSNLITGSANTLIGYHAGNGYTTSETENICIGNLVLGTAGESHAIRIGRPGVATTCYLAGVYGVTPAGTNHLVTANSVTGQLGTTTPSSFALNVITNSGTAVENSSNQITLTSGRAASSGSSVSFTGAGSTITMDMSDGNENTIIGSTAGNSSISGSFNTGLGVGVLFGATSAENNTAIGVTSMEKLTTGINNVAVGNLSLDRCVTGSYNTCVGVLAGDAYTTSESSNILLGNNGVNGESNVIRIGNDGSGSNQQNKCFVAAIFGTTTDSATTEAVYVSDGNQLGTTSSSARFKDDIEDMADASSVLLNLRPVTFKYKKHYPNPRLQYGLIAEEVYEVMPGIVNIDKEGLPFSVKYHDMPALLLNELQKAVKRIQELEDRLKNM